MRIQVAAVLFLFTLTSVAFMNCSQENYKGALADPDGENSDSSFSVGGPGPSEYETADMSGNIPAYQDVQFRFKVPGFQSGAIITGTNLPAWLIADNANGELAGLPEEIGSYSGIVIKVTRGGQVTNSGPYTIKVSGDSMKYLQWHLQNTGQTLFSKTKPVSGNDIKMTTSVRSRVLGQGVKIAVSDSGLIKSHPGLAAAIIPNASRNYSQNFNATGTWLGDPTPPSNEPLYAHGTAVAGLIGERGWNGSGGRGVAPQSQLAGFLFVPAFNSLVTNGLYSVAYLDQFSGNFDIFNYSWGDPQCALFEYDQVLKDKLKAGTALRGGKGALFFKAAGNEFINATTTCYPGAASNAYTLGNANFSEDGVSPYLMMVGALRANGSVASYSSPGANLWISAPGGEGGLMTSPNNDTDELQPALVTTDSVGCGKGWKTFSGTFNAFNTGAAPNSQCTHTSTFNGTSSASPIAAGAAALLLTVNPALTWRDVKHILAVTAFIVDPSAGNTSHPGGSAFNPNGHVYQRGWVTNAAGIKYHNWYGFGRVNVDAAVAMARAYTSQLGVFRETNIGGTYKYNSGNINQAIIGGNSTGGGSTPNNASSTLTVAENYKIESVIARVSASGCVGALGLELTSPSGTRSILMNIHSQLQDTAITSHEFQSNAFYNENSVGAWTLKVINPRANCTATFQNWQINIYGH
jgi:subtilisin family serine protease